MFMDLLFKKYASPFLLLNGYIITNSFDDFIQYFIENEQKEKSDSVEWEYYLHKVFDKSFYDWREELRNKNNNLNMDKEQIKTTVANSLSILKDFKPNMKGG